jgi:predicted phosphoribosyltransferase
MFYADFHQVGDEEVVDLLNHAADFLEEETPLPTP